MGLNKVRSCLPRSEPVVGRARGVRQRCHCKQLLVIPRVAADAQLTGGDETGIAGSVPVVARWSLVSQDRRRGSMRRRRQHKGSPVVRNRLRSWRRLSCVSLTAKFATERPGIEQASVRHSITSVAWISSACGKRMPSARAVRWFSTNWKVVACSMGRSAGFAPLRMRSTKYAPRWKMPSRSGP